MKIGFMTSTLHEQGNTVQIMMGFTVDIGIVMAHLDELLIHIHLLVLEIVCEAECVHIIISNDVLFSTCIWVTTITKEKVH